MSEPNDTYAIIGDPVEHSLSPLLHSFIYRQLNLPYNYRKIRIPANRLKEFIINCREDNLQGFNVTIPHKEAIISFLDELDPKAEFIGAVNTVKKEYSILTGYNTDVIGCKTALDKSSWPGTGKVVILGAGGACRSALIALSNFALSSVHIVNRTLEKAVKLKKQFSHYVKFDIYAENLTLETIGNLLKQASLLINTTPVGMWPHIQDSPIPDLAVLPDHLTIFDMVPNPVYTTLLRQAEKKGVNIISGLSMLISQALAAQEIWLDRTLPETLYTELWSYVNNKMSKQHG